MTGAALVGAPPLRVALLDPGDFTPAYDEELAAALTRLGHQVVLVGKHGGPGSSRELRRPAFYRLLAGRRARALPASLGRVVKGVHHIVDMVRLAGLVRDMRADIVHAQWLPLPLVDAAFAGRLRRIAPLVLTVHDARPYHGAANRLMEVGFARAIGRMDAVIVHTRSTLCQLQARGIPADRLEIVPHGALHTPARPRPAGRPPAAGRLRLLQFGKIKAYKGVDVLIEALALVPADLRRRLQVRIVGAPYLDPAPLERRLAELGLDDVVELRLGAVPDDEMMRCFDEADCMVFPYRQVDASGVLMAALAHGLPIVASRIGDFAERLEDGREAVLVEPGDPQALAAALGGLVSAPERLVAMRRAAERTCQALPDWDEIARRTVGVYRKAQARRLGRGRALAGAGPQAEAPVR